MRQRNVDLGPMSLPVGVERPADDSHTQADSLQVRHFESLMLNSAGGGTPRDARDQRQDNPMEEAILVQLAQDPDDESLDGLLWRIHLPAQTDGPRRAAAMDITVCRDRAVTHLDVALTTADAAQARWLSTRAGEMATSLGRRTGLAVSVRVRIGSSDPDDGPASRLVGARVAR